MEYTVKRRIFFNDENDKFITLSRGAHVRDDNNSFVINDEYVTSHFGMFRNDAPNQQIINSTDLIEDYDIEKNDVEIIRALKFTTDGPVTFNLKHIDGYDYDLQYSFDNLTWNQLYDDGDVDDEFIPYNAITLNADETFYLRGNNPQGFGFIDVPSCALKIDMQGDGNVSCTGNIMHLLSYETDMTEIPCDGCFASLFAGCKNLVNAPQLPATTLTESCYEYMFNSCTNLVTAPELPAIELTFNCYANMFYGCTNLVNAPKLPATKLMTNCYSNMFGWCTNLVTAPELPATELDMSCYANMFTYCTNLVNAPKLPATKLATNCYSNMFNNCTNLVTAPELPATTLAMSCYERMFWACTKLQTITCLYEKSNLFNYTNYWMQSVPSGGTFYTCANPQYDTTQRGSNYIPTGWNVVPKVA